MLPVGILRPPELLPLQAIPCSRSPPRPGARLRNHVFLAPAASPDLGCSNSASWQAQGCSRGRKNGIWAMASNRDWLDYEKAVEVRDLSTALEVLESNNPLVEVVVDSEEGQEDAGGSPSLTMPVEEQEFLLKVLDACIDCQDMKLVCKTYGFLRGKGLLSNFGRYKSRASEGERLVTPMAMKEIAGVEASKLSPKKWGVSGKSAIVVISAIVLQSVLKNNGIDIRPLLVVVMGLGLTDAIYLGGTGLSQILSFWLPYRRRVLTHEAGHILVAYLLGCPVRGVVLDAFQAMKLGIQGQAGTQFWDASLEEELLLGRLTSTSLDRYCMVIFAGIAAEALVYGEAEGGESDENLYMSIITGLSPVWSLAKRGNQARWAVLQSFKLLKEHEQVHKAVTKALENGATMSTIVKTIEASMEGS